MTERESWLKRHWTKRTGTQFDWDYVFHKVTRRLSDTRGREKVWLDAIREHDDRGHMTTMRAFQDAADDALWSLEQYDRHDQGGDHGRDD